MNHYQQIKFPNKHVSENCLSVHKLFVFHKETKQRALNILGHTRSPFRSTTHVTKCLDFLNSFTKMEFMFPDFVLNTNRAVI